MLAENTSSSELYTHHLVFLISRRLKLLVSKQFTRLIPIPHT